jgi:hypothetical protein
MVHLRTGIKPLFLFGFQQAKLRTMSVPVLHFCNAAEIRMKVMRFAHQSGLGESPEKSATSRRINHLRPVEGAPAGDD